MKITSERSLVVVPGPVPTSPILDVLPDGTVTLTLVHEGTKLTAHLHPDEADGNAVGLIRAATIGRSIAEQGKIRKTL